MSYNLKLVKQADSKRLVISCNFLVQHKIRAFCNIFRKYKEHALAPIMSIVNHIYKKTKPLLPVLWLWYYQSIHRWLQHNVHSKQISITEISTQVDKSYKYNLLSSIESQNFEPLYMLKFTD